MDIKIDSSPSKEGSFFKHWIFGDDFEMTFYRSLVLGIFIFITLEFAFIPVMVRGKGMEPTIRSGSLHVIDALYYHIRFPNRDDIVGIRLAGKRAVYLTRVIGLPGESVEIRDGKIFINGSLAKKVNLPENLNYSTTVAYDKVFVMGDGIAEEDTDSLLGLVDQERIIGKLLI
jgi:signal peptidase I